MSKYMFHANYTQGGLGGLLKEGGRDGGKR